MGAPPEIPDRVRQLAAGHQLGGLLRVSVNQKRSNWAYPGAGSPAQALYLYQSGLVMVRGKQTEAARWDDAERYWWQSTESPTDSPDDIFCTIRRRDGVELTFEGHEKLAEEIGKAIARAYLPAMLAHLGTGGQVPFGAGQREPPEDQRGGAAEWSGALGRDRGHHDGPEDSQPGQDRRRGPSRILAGGRHPPLSSGSPGRTCRAHDLRAPEAAGPWPGRRVPGWPGADVRPAEPEPSRPGRIGRADSPWQEIRYLWVHQDERLVEIKLQGRRFFWQKIPTWQVGDAMALHGLLFCLNLRIIARIGRDRTPTIVLVGTSWPLRPVEDIYRVGVWAERAEPDYLWYLNRVRHDEAAADWSS